MSIPANTPITLPLFESVTLHIPDYYVLPGKKQGQFKLVQGLTPSGKTITTRQGHKAIKVKSNEKNELYLEEKDFGNPRIEYGMFSPKDQQILRKYFANESPKPKQFESSTPSNYKIGDVGGGGPRLESPSVSTISTDRTMDIGTDVILPSGKKKYKVYKTREREKSEQKTERNAMAGEDSRRIRRMALMADKAAKKKLPPIMSKREEQLLKSKIPDLKSILSEYKIKFTKMKKDDMIKAILSHEKIPEGVKWDPQANWLYEDLKKAHTLLDPSSFADANFRNLKYALTRTKIKLLSTPKHQSSVLRDEIDKLTKKVSDAETLLKRDFEKEYNDFMSKFKPQH